MKRIKVAICSYSDSEGGAARAALGHHKALLSQNIDSVMLVGSRKTDLLSVHGPSGKLSKGLMHLRREISQWLSRLQITSNKNLHSLQFLPSKIAASLNVSDFDIVNLHWICSELISIEDIGRLRRPVVWTLHDMWPILGAEHYVGEEGFSRAIEGYSKGNRLRDSAGLDLDRWCWNRKKKAWRYPFHIVVSSQWMKGKVEASSLMGGWPVTVIPNVIDLDRFRPYDKICARKILGLPPDRKILAFGASGGLSDERKGGDLLISAMDLINSAVPILDVLIFGQSKPVVDPFGHRNMIHWLGPVRDDIVLSLIYSAADVVIVPSRQDNLPLTAAEAQSCACPVVAFDSTGLPDLVEHKSTGYLAKAYDIRDLARGVVWVLEDKDRHDALGKAARKRAERLWAKDTITAQYMQVYIAAIESRNL